VYLQALWPHWMTPREVWKGFQRPFQWISPKHKLEKHSFAAAPPWRETRISRFIWPECKERRRWPDDGGEGCGAKGRRPRLEGGPVLGIRTALAVLERRGFCFTRLNDALRQRLKSERCIVHKSPAKKGGLSLASALSISCISLRR
jgi:hypothetical protein